MVMAKRRYKSTRRRNTYRTPRAYKPSKYTTGYIEYKVGKKVYKKKINLPKYRTRLGITEWNWDSVEIGYFNRKGEYKYRFYKVPDDADWVRLKVGKKVVSRGH